MSHTVRPTPGWYADPDDSTLLRWWNGTQWSEHTQPMPQEPVITQERPPASGATDGISVRSDLGDAPATVSAPPAEPPATPTEPTEAPPTPRGRKRRWLLVVLTLVILAAAGAAAWFLWLKPTAVSNEASAAATSESAPAAPVDAPVPGACSDVVSALTADGTSRQLAAQLEGAGSGADLTDTASFLATIGPVTNDLLANSGAACVAAVNAGQGPAAYAAFVTTFQGAMTSGTQTVNAALSQPGGLTPEQKVELTKQAADLTAATAAVTKDTPPAPAAPPAG